MKKKSAIGETDVCHIGQSLEAGFAMSMNGQVNTHNVRAYAVARQPPEFNYQFNICRDNLTVWIGHCGNGSTIGPFSLKEMSLDKFTSK